MHEQVNDLVAELPRRVRGSSWQARKPKPFQPVEHDMLTAVACGLRSWTARPLPQGPGLEDAV